MATVIIPKKELKIMIKESISEALTEELMKLQAFLLPSVSQKEQRDFEKLYGKPSRKVAKSVKIKI